METISAYWNSFIAWVKANMLLAIGLLLGIPLALWFVFKMIKKKKIHAKRVRAAARARNAKKKKRRR